MIKPNLEQLVYIVVVALSLTVLALLACSPSFSADTTLVYQGF